MIKKLLLLLVLALPIYHRTPYGGPLNPLDQPPNPYQRDCYIEQPDGSIEQCKF